MFITCARNTNTWTCQHAWVGTVTQLANRVLRVIQESTRLSAAPTQCIDIFCFAKPTICSSTEPPAASWRANPNHAAVRTSTGKNHWQAPFGMHEKHVGIHRAVGWALRNYVLACGFAGRAAAAAARSAGAHEVCCMELMRLLLALVTVSILEESLETELQHERDSLMVSWCCVTSLHAPPPPLPIS